MAKEEQILSELKETIREAHGLIKDIRREQKQSQELRDQVVDALAKAIASGKEAVASHINEQVKVGLEEYKASIDTAIDKATQAVFKRFDTLADIMMGEEMPDQENLVSLVRRWKAKGN